LGVYRLPLVRQGIHDLFEDKFEEQKTNLKVWIEYGKEHPKTCTLRIGKP
jgi:hypothetical protein